MWYVLHVRTGQEREVQRALLLREYDALAPTEARMIRSGGAWQEKDYTLFPGYVFVYLDYTPAAYHAIKEIPGVINFLPDARAAPLPPQEADYILNMGCDTIRPSPVDFHGEEPAVLGGILKDLEDQIIRFDRHRRRAIVRINIHDRPHDIPLSIIPVFSDTPPTGS